MKTKVGTGVVSDIGFTVGVNWGADANVRKYLPGLRLSLDLPGFAFANLYIAAYLDDNEGAASGGAPREDDAFLVDFSFARPFSIGESSFSIEGHVEYVAERENEFGGTVESWILAQPPVALEPERPHFARYRIPILDEQAGRRRPPTRAPCRHCSSGSSEDYLTGSPWP